MTENFTPADLIYLYLDGEADAVQQTTMFAALAADPELQQEFSEALSMHRAFEHERSSAKPPIYLTTRVMQDAGVLPKALGVGAVGGGLLMWLRKAAIPVGSLLLGSVVTFFAMNWISPRQSSTQSSKQPSAVSNLASSGSTPAYNSAQSSSATTNSQTASLNSVSGSTSNEANIRSRAVQTHVSSVSYARSGRRLSALAEENNGHESDRTARQAAPGMQILPPDQAEQNDAADRFMQQAVAVEFARAYENTSYSKKLAMVNVPVSPFNTGKNSDFSLQFNRLASASVVGTAPGTANPGFVSEPSVTILYNLNENASVGAGFTSGRYSISNITKSGVALQNPQLSCWSIEYQRISAEDFMLGAQGYVKVGSGLSWNSGATLGLLNGSFGLSFPVSVIQLNAGFAFESFWYQTQSSNYTSDFKGGFVVGLGYNW